MSFNRIIGPIIGPTDLGAPVPLRKDSKHMALRGSVYQKLSRRELWDRFFASWECGEGGRFGWGLRLDELVLVDCDSHQAVEWARGNLRRSVEVSTARGLHIYFRRNGVEPPRGRIVAGEIVLDVLSGRKDVAVMVGTTVGGHTYRYVQNASPAQRDLAVLDAEAVCRLRALAEPGAERDVGDGGERREKIPQDHEAHIVKLLAGVRQGERDTACVRLAAHFLYRRKLSEGEARELLIAWNLRNVPPWSGADGSSPERWVDDKLARLGCHRKESDSPDKAEACVEAVLDFVSERCDMGGEYRFEQSEFYEFAESWLRDRGYSFSRNRIGRVLEDLLPIRELVYRYPAKGIRGVRFLSGIRLCGCLTTGSRAFTTRSGSRNSKRQ